MNNSPNDARRTARAAVATALVVVFAAATALATPTLDINPVRVAPGGVVLMTINGFVPGGYDGTVVVDGVPGSTVYIPFSGHLAFFWPVPATLTPGRPRHLRLRVLRPGRLEERTNTVRLAVDSGNLSGSEYNLSRGASKSPRACAALSPPDRLRAARAWHRVVEGANRRTVAGASRAIAGWTRTRSRRARRLLEAVRRGSRGAATMGPPPRSSARGSAAQGGAERPRADLTRTWNFVCRPRRVRLDPRRPSATFDLTIMHQPRRAGRLPECASCFDDNTVHLNGNEIRHVGVSNDYAMTFRPCLVEAR